MSLQYLVKHNDWFQIKDHTIIRQELSIDMGKDLLRILRFIWLCFWTKKFQTFININTILLLTSMTLAFSFFLLLFHFFRFFLFFFLMLLLYYPSKNLLFETVYSSNSPHKHLCSRSLWYNFWNCFTDISSSWFFLMTWCPIRHWLVPFKLNIFKAKAKSINILCIVGTCLRFFGRWRPSCISMVF